MSYFNPDDYTSWEAPQIDPKITEQRLRAEALRSQPRPRQTGGGGGVNPMQAYNVYSKFAGGSSGSGGAAASTSGEGWAAPSNYVAPAIAMAGLVKAGDKLKIGAKDQGHFYSKWGKKLDLGDSYKNLGRKLGDLF